MLAGEAAKGRTILEEVVNKRRHLVGPDDADTLLATMNLAEAYRTDKKPAKAVALLEQAVPLSRKKLGDDHPTTLLGMVLLGAGYYDVYRPDKAGPLLEQAVPKCKTTLGACHRNTLLGMYTLAHVYADAGQFTDAIPLLEEALKLRRSRGLRDDAGLKAMARLASWHLEVHEPEKAMALFRKRLELERQRPGSDDVAYLHALGTAVNALWDHDRLAEAEKLVRDCVAGLAKDGPDAWATHAANAFLGAILVREKQYAEAEPLLLAAHAGMQGRPQTQTRVGRYSRIAALKGLTHLYRETNRPEKAAKWRDALEMADPYERGVTAFEAGRMIGQSPTSPKRSAPNLDVRTYLPLAPPAGTRKASTTRPLPTSPRPSASRRASPRPMRCAAPALRTGRTTTGRLRTSARQFASTPRTARPITAAHASGSGAATSKRRLPIWIQCCASSPTTPARTPTAAIAGDARGNPTKQWLTQARQSGSTPRMRLPTTCVPVLGMTRAARRPRRSPT